MLSFPGLCCVPSFHNMQGRDWNCMQQAGMLRINLIIGGSLPVIAVQERGGVIV